ncbi:MAG: sel1 repeat family protein [Bacteroidetes bacterium]|nr:sel1 repeat family protein [Bacteroidota bacterium]
MFWGDEQELKQAYFWLKTSAEQGNAEAQYRLAVLFQRGKGVTKDKDQALYWYKKSAENGSSDGQRELGTG